MKHAYHHRDLRRALVDEALAVLDADGIGGLTLRELGRRLGVTHAAAYAHFPDKGALLREVAAIGFQRLAGACAAATAGAATPRAAFVQMGRAYRAFALASPNLYRLMFADATLSADGTSDDASPIAQAPAAFEQLVGLVARVTGADPHAAHEAAIVVWATMHGLVMLELDARIGGTFKQLADPVGVASALLLDGLERYAPADARNAALPG